MGEVTECGSCGNMGLTLLLHMGDQPLAERDDGRRYPLALRECSRCKLVQLSYSVDRQVLFPPGHPYSTGNTAAMRAHFAGLAADLAPQLNPGELVIDIGANDGTFLAAMREAAPGVRLLGIEPTGQADKCAARGLKTEKSFFSEALATVLAGENGRAAVITASNVLAHVPEPHDFLQGVMALLAPDGVFVTENHDWASVSRGLQIDAIYHEHARYFSLGSLSYLLARHDLQVTDSEPVAVHGGSFRVQARPRTGDLAGRARDAADELHALMSAAALAGPVYGIGATTRATPLIHYAKIAEYLQCVCEVPQSDKIGMCIPGTSIPVVDEERLFTDQPPHALLLSWHLADDLIPKLRAGGYKGQLIIPLPVPRIYQDS